MNDFGRLVVVHCLSELDMLMEGFTIEGVDGKSLSLQTCADWYSILPERF